MPNLLEIDNYPPPPLLVPRIIKEHGYSEEYASGAVKEAKRMLFISAKAMQAVVPTEPIDIAWHEMLMFTRFYKDFSNFIGAFVHHEPLGGDTFDPKDPVYLKTKELYRELLGEEPNPIYWN